MMRDMYLLQAKKPSESNGEWDLMNVVATILAEVDFCRGYELANLDIDAPVGCLENSCGLTTRASAPPRLARISHTTRRFCEVPWRFPIARTMGERDGGAECAASSVMFFGSPWASG